MSEPEQLRVIKLSGSEHSGLGILLSVAALSPDLGARSLAEMQHSALNGILAQRVAVLLDANIPVGFVLWGDMNALVAARARTGLLSLQPSDLQSGQQRWLLHFCCPVLPEHARFLKDWIQREIAPVHVVNNGTVELWPSI